MLSNELAGDVDSPVWVVLLGLASLALMGAGIAGVFGRLMWGQHDYFVRLYSALRDEGHLVDDATVPLRASSQEELETLDLRIHDAEVALRGVPEHRLKSLEHAIDLIERDRERVDKAQASIPLHRSAPAAIPIR